MALPEPNIDVFCSWSEGIESMLHSIGSVVSDEHSGQVLVKTSGRILYFLVSEYWRSRYIFCNAELADKIISAIGSRTTKYAGKFGNCYGVTSHNAVDVIVVNIIEELSQSVSEAAGFSRGDRWPLWTELPKPAQRMIQLIEINECSQQDWWTIAADLRTERVLFMAEERKRLKLRGLSECQVATLQKLRALYNDGQREFDDRELIREFTGEDGFYALIYLLADLNAVGPKDLSYLWVEYVNKPEKDRAPRDFRPIRPAILTHYAFEKLANEDQGVKENQWSKAMTMKEWHTLFVNAGALGRESERFFRDWVKVPLENGQADRLKQKGPVRFRVDFLREVNVRVPD